jgi:hypothetical protein
LIFPFSHYQTFQLFFFIFLFFQWFLHVFLFWFVTLCIYCYYLHDEALELYNFFC